MRFDELILQIPNDELRLRFHPQLTVLSGLGPTERLALAESLIGALSGGAEDSLLHGADGTGEPLTIASTGRHVTAARPDGTPVPTPIGSLAPDAASLRLLMLVRPDDLSEARQRRSEDEPAELREARDTLEALTDELEQARQQHRAAGDLAAELEHLDEQLHLAREGQARREYAQVLAQLERVRAEAAALDTTPEAIEADRQLLASVEQIRQLAERWTQTAERVAGLRMKLPERRLAPTERERLAAIPEAPPEGLEEHLEVLRQAAHRRDHLDLRLQDLAVSKLPAPSDPIVASLGLLGQPDLWHAARRLADATERLRQLQLSLGGLEIEDLGPAPEVIEEIEQAHSEVEAADRAVEAARLPGLAGAGLGVTAGVISLAAAPLLAPVALAGAAVAASAGLIRPKARAMRAAKAEQDALQRAEATSYLGFHIRRVEASVDPRLRIEVESAKAVHQDAAQAWQALVGSSVDVAAALLLRPEIEAYNAALRELGDTADEMEHLRRELELEAGPAWAAARADVAAICLPYLVDDARLDDPQLAAVVTHQCRLGASARAEVALHQAEIDEQKAAGRLEDLLLLLGFDAGELDARVGAMEWAVTRAGEREDARRRARPRTEIDADLSELQIAASRLRRPEWDTVTAAEADLPDIPELEARRHTVVQQLTEVRGDVDVDRLADRHAAIERRVVALEARYGAALDGDPEVLAKLQDRLLGHLTLAATAGGEGVPVVLDEALLRVPPDRLWDLLDQLLRLAERHQMIYLTEDAFVAAWARQRALDGSLTLMEPAPEPELDHEIELTLEAEHEPA